MRRHAKAPSSESSTRPRRVALFVCVLAAFLGIGASAAMAAPPTLSIDPVAANGITTAHVSGEVSVPADGIETYWCFEYAEEGVGNWSGFCYQGPVQPGESAPVEADLTGLKADTAYEVRLAALNFSEFIEEFSEAPNPTFTTDPAPVAPTASVEPAASVSFTSAQIQGAVNPQGGNDEGGGAYVPIHWALELSSDGSSFGPVASGDLTSGEGAESPTAIDVPSSPAVLTNLALNHTYTYRLVVTYAGQEVEPAPEGEFTTLAATNAPTLAVEPATQLARTSAHVSGTLDPHGGNVDAQTGPLPIQWKFQFAKASEPGEWHDAKSGTLEGSEAESPDPIDLEADLAGLATGTQYLYRLTAGYGGEEASSGNGSFETLSSAGPDVAAEAAIHVSPESAYLEGSVNPNEESTLYWFEYGTADCAVSTCAAVPVKPEEGGEGLILAKRDAGAGTTPIAGSAAIGGLDPAATYHFRILAENASGTSASGDETFTTPAAPGPQKCANEARRTEQRSGFLGDCRAWEMVSPPDKENKDVMSNTTLVRVAASESPGLPMAATFSSLGAFGDVTGTGVRTEYLAQRDGSAGTSGWSTHAITPLQEPLSFYGAVNLYPLYEGDMSDDLTHGIFRTWTPLGAENNVKDVMNLYMRPDLRTAGAGTYQLATPASFALPPITDQKEAPFLDGASEDFNHLVFESKLNLTPDATGINFKLYKSDNGAVRLISDGSGVCPPSGSPTPCSGGGAGISELLAKERVISGDGARVNFTAPRHSTAPGRVSRLYQFDDLGTASPGDDVTIQLNASEKTSPDIAQAAQYQTASVDGSRVFFLSNEQLTDTPGSGLYMWERQATDESQSVTVDATGGTFTLTAHRQPSVGAGTLTSGSVMVAGVNGSFMVGQTISGSGITPGTTVVRLVSGGELELSAPATADGPTSLVASVQRTTYPLPWNASAAQVQAALESLDIVGSGNVDVSGGPEGSAPFVVTFVGGLAGVNVMPLTADPSGLTGAAASVTVTTTTPIRNLTLIGRDVGPVFGASEDGHRVYFAASGQLIPGGPPILFGSGVFAWQDADGTPGGTLSFVGVMDTVAAIGNGLNRSIGVASGRITPDGRHLLFRPVEGVGLAPAYPHGTCTSIIGVFDCGELYLYSADSSTPLDPDVVCASCDLNRPAAPYDTRLNVSRFDGVTGFTSHLNRGTSADGRYVFFSSEAPLVPEDINSTWDAYEYDTQAGEHHLLSSGTDSGPSFFMEAREDGHDVFFTTRQRLVGWDQDSAYDLYDARAGGGFTEPPVENTKSCQGESCRPAAPGAPPAQPASSASLTGLGNPKPPKPCPRHKRRVNGRCVKKTHKHHHKRHVNRDRRASR